MDTDWKKLLRRQASLHHMCEENRSALEEVNSKADAIALYKKTIDWALEEDYPDLYALRRYFNDCELYGIFIDKEFHGETLMDQQVYVFHNCTGTIRTGLNLEKEIIPMLYFANNCDMSVRSAAPVGTSIRVPIYIFGDNKISAEHSEDMDSVIYKFDVK